MSLIILHFHENRFRKKEKNNPLKNVKFTNAKGCINTIAKGHSLYPIELHRASPTKEEIAHSHSIRFYLYQFHSYTRLASSILHTFVVSEQERTRSDPVTISNDTPLGLPAMRMFQNICILHCRPTWKNIKEAQYIFGNDS